MERGRPELFRAEAARVGVALDELPDTTQGTVPRRLAEDEAKRRRAPTPPTRPDWRAIHTAFTHSAGTLNSQFLAVVAALENPSPDLSLSPAATTAIDALHATLTGVRLRIAKVKPSSSPRTQILAYLDASGTSC